MTVVGTSLLGDGLTIWNLRLTILNLYLLVVLKSPLQRAQVELTLTMDDGLSQFLRLLNNPCRVFLPHLGEGSHKLLHLLLVDSLDRARVLRVGILDEVILIVAVFLVEGVSCLNVLKLNGTTDVAGAKLVNGDTVGSRTSIYLCHALLGATVCIR